jgi:hypothetical protein
MEASSFSNGQQENDSRGRVPGSNTVYIRSRGPFKWGGVVRGRDAPILGGEDLAREKEPR